MPEIVKDVMMKLNLLNLVVVVDERDITGVHCPAASLLPMMLPFLVIPNCCVVAGHKNGEHRLAHSKGGRRDGLEYRGNHLPVAQRVVRHVEKGV